MRHHQNEIRLSHPLVYIDTEWTDLDPEERRIVSIAITRFETDGSQQSRYWLVNPQRNISEQSTAVHGIQQADIDRQPNFRAIAKEVEQMLGDADIAGYSVTNDIEIIEREMTRTGRKWTANGRHIIDAYRLWQVREPRTLSHAYRRFVGEADQQTQAHDARDDVAMTIAIINAMHNGKNISELHQEAHHDMIDPAGKFRTDNGQVVFNFGPYRGIPVNDHPEYLYWMTSKSFAPSTLQEARSLLSRIYESQPPFRI